MRLFGYVRVSSREQEQGYSIDAQTKRLQDFCASRGHVLVRMFREVETAKKAGRPVFNEMIAALKKDASIEGVLTHKVDRLCRNFKDYVLVDEITQTGKKFLFVEEEFAPTAAGKLTFGMKVLLAKHYIDNLSDEVKKGMVEKVAQGGYPCHAPWGYKNVKAPHSLEPDPLRAPLVHQLFEWYATGRESLESVREKFIATGIPYRPSAPKPAKSVIEFILKNRAYTGWFDFLGERYKGAYEPIITDSLFERVQKAFNGRGRGSGHRGVQINFRGLFLCHSCRCRITGTIKKGKYTYYTCTHMRGPCPEPALREEKLDAEIQDVLRQLDHGDDLLAAAKEGYLDKTADRRQQRETERARLEERVGKLREFMNRGYEDKLEGRITEEFWAEKDKAWKAELEAVTQRLEALKKDQVGKPETAVKLLELSQTLHRVWPTRTVDQKRRIVEITHWNSTLSAGKLRPAWNSPFDLIAEGPKVKEWWAILDSNQ